MMYMFPRQFGLHNVFTSQVDHTQTAQKFQDYTLREEEITRKFCTSGEGTQHFKAHIPKRLRGPPQHLVERLRVFHDRCSYAKLLEHYCPVRCLISAHPAWLANQSVVGARPEQTPDAYISRYTEADQISKEVAARAATCPTTSTLILGRVSNSNIERICLLSRRTGKDRPEGLLGKR